MSCFIRIHSGIHRKACHIGHNLHSNGAVKSFAKIDGLVKRMERVCIESSSGLQQIVRIMMRAVLVIVTTTRRVTTKMIIAMKTRATRKTTPTALTHTTPTAPLRPHQPRRATKNHRQQRNQPAQQRQRDTSQPRPPYVQKNRDTDNHLRKIGRESYARSRVSGDYADMNDDCAEGLIRDFEGDTSFR